MSSVAEQSAFHKESYSRQHLFLKQSCQLTVGVLKHSDNMPYTTEATSNAFSRKVAPKISLFFFPLFLSLDL